MTSSNRPRNPAFTTLETYPFVRLDEAKAATRAKGVRVIDFTIGDPHEETPSRIRERLLRSVLSEAPTTCGGHARPARAIAAWIETRFGVRCDPRGTSSPRMDPKEAVYLIHQAVVDPSGSRRAVLIPDPAYPVYEIGTRFAGGEPVPVRLKPELGFLPDLDALSPSFCAGQRSSGSTTRTTPPARSPAGVSSAASLNLARELRLLAGFRRGLFRDLLR